MTGKGEKFAGLLDMGCFVVCGPIQKSFSNWALCRNAIVEACIRIIAKERLWTVLGI